MHKTLLLILSAAVAGVAVLASPAVAQQKTVKACQQEWRANKAANQAGVTEKAYVEKCRAGTAAQTTPAPTQAPAAAKPAPAKPAPAKPAAADTAAPKKTVKACEDEWRANRAANQAAGVTQKAYVEKCRAGAATAQPAPSAAPASAPSAPPAASRPSQPAAPAPSAAPAQAPTRTPAAAGQPAGANQYASEAQAKARCPSDTVVWVNLDSKIYHYSSYRNYGQTKSGAFMCEKDTATAGFRAAKNEKRP